MNLRFNLRVGVLGLWALGGLWALPASAQTYSIDFIATASSGAAMDRSGRTIAGTTTLPPSCKNCTPTTGVPVIWRDGVMFPLSIPDDGSYLSFAGINVNGWVAGSSMRFDSTGGAGYVWKPRSDGSGYDALAIGSLPNLEDSMPAGIDDKGRVFGLARTWMQAQDAFMWNESKGIRSLSGLGYPADPPVAVSPGGTIATPTLTYRYGDVASVSAVATPPSGYLPASSTAIGAINDAGLRAGFLISTSSQGYRYLARYADDRGWEVLSSSLSSSARYGVGSVTKDGALTATLVSNGYRAAGPDSPVLALAASVSPAYGSVGVSHAGAEADDGSILAQATIGQSARLVKLVPVQACTTDCIKVSSLNIKASLTSPRGQCSSRASTSVTVDAKVVDELGAPLAGAVLSGYLLDDYYLQQAFSATTDAAGAIQIKTKTAACVGAMAFLVDEVTHGTRRLDRSQGQLARYVVPQ